MIHADKADSHRYVAANDVSKYKANLHSCGHLVDVVAFIKNPSVTADQNPSVTEDILDHTGFVFLRRANNP